MGIYLDNTELEAMERVSLLARAAYLCIRRRMDLATFRTGLVTSISYQALRERCEVEIPRGQGVQLDMPSKGAVERAIKRLVACGLVRRVGNAERLVFECEMAKAAQLRRNQTREGGERGYPQPIKGRDFAGKPLINKVNLDSWRDGLPHSGGAFDGANPSNIGVSGIYPPLQSSSNTGREVGDDAAAAAGDEVEIAPLGGSQAAPGGDGGDVYRDQPPLAASEADDYRGHPTGGEEGGRDQSGCAPIRVVAPNPLKIGLAAGDALLDERHGCGDLVKEYIKILDARHIRVPAAHRGILVEWAQRGVLPAHVRGGVDRAFGARKKSGSTQPVGLGYLAQCVRSEMAELERAARALSRVANPDEQPRKERDGWQGRLLRLGESAEVAPPRPGEEWKDYARRVQAAIGARTGGPAPAFDGAAAAEAAGANPFWQ